MDENVTPNSETGQYSCGCKGQKAGTELSLTHTKKTRSTQIWTSHGARGKVSSFTP